MFGTLLPRIAEDFGWTTATSTATATLVAVGIAIVAILVGPMIDYLGRKKSLVVTTAGTGISSLLTGLTPAAFAAVWLTIVRAISGPGYSEQAAPSATSPDRSSWRGLLVGRY